MAALMDRNRGFVKELQEQLVERGLDIGRTGADGIRGRYTNQALSSLPREDQEKIIKEAREAVQLRKEQGHQASPQSRVAPTAQTLTPRADKPQSAAPDATPQPRHGSRSHLKQEQAVTPQEPGHPLAMDKTAVFDPQSGKLFLPNGQTFDANSGKGYDETVKNKGVTPKGTWKVGKPEMANFKMANGDEIQSKALRLSPTDDVNTHGRDGFLIHESHGGSGQSLGCIVSDPKMATKIMAAREKNVFNEIKVLEASADLKPDDTIKRKSMLATKGHSKSSKLAMAAPSPFMPAAS